MTTPRDARDRGSVLPLVLVLIVIAGFVIVPVLTYTASVLRANSVVSSRTKQVEAAKGGLRAVLSDPIDVFQRCDSSGVNLGAGPVVNGIAPTSTCSLVDDVGSIEALGGEVPFGSVSTQLGSQIPSHFIVGAAGTSDSVVAGGTTADWWHADADALPTTGQVWQPHLPRIPSLVRSSTPFDMPAAFGCKVYFPGRYADPLVLDPASVGSDHVYFASGVYYFESPITVSGDIDIVVGYGLQDFGDECADDLQVAANVIGNTGGFAIDGGGATWVFGADARLEIDDSAGSPSVRFNQRYAGSDDVGTSAFEGFERGRRINIMSVNGDARGLGADHDVSDLTNVPRSRTISDAGDDVTPATIEPIDGTGYAPTSVELTDAARAPETPGNFTVEAGWYDDGGTPRGAALVTWDAVLGADTNGALLTGYDVTVTPTPPAPFDDPCGPDDLVAYDDAGVTRVACLVSGLTIGSTASISVTAGNGAPFDNVSVAAGPSDATPSTAPADEISVPDAVTDVGAADADIDDVARVSWTPGDNGGAPVTRYDVTATRVYTEPRPASDPVAENVLVFAADGATTTVQLPIHDANGGPTTVDVDDTSVPGWSVSPTGRSVAVTPLAGTTPGTYGLSYDVTDDTGRTVTAAFDVEVFAPALPPGQHDPVAFDATLTPDLGTPTTYTLPATDADGDDLTVALDTSAVADTTVWTVSLDDTTDTVTITTTAPDGSYVVPYTVTDPGGAVAMAELTIDVARSTSPAGTCSAVATASTVLAPTCDIPLPDLDPLAGDIGYRFDVVAVNGVGASTPVPNADPLPLAFDGTGSPLVVPPTALVPYDPVPIISVDATGPGSARLAIPGYVAVPMSKISIDNPDGDPISMTGGVIAGTFDVPDGWLVPSIGAPATPIGFWDQVILQRTVRIVTTAGRATSIAVVQVNEDGGSYAINTWSVQ